MIIDLCMGLVLSSRPCCRCMARSQLRFTSAASKTDVNNLLPVTHEGFLVKDLAACNEVTKVW